MLQPMNDRHDLEIALSSHFPLLTIQSHEETRVLTLLRDVALRLRRPLYTWSLTEGLKRDDMGFEPSVQWSRIGTEMGATPQNKETEKGPGEMLTQLAGLDDNAVVVLCDFHPYLQENLAIRHIKEIALAHESRPLNVVLLSHDVELPSELQPFAATFELSLPDEATLRALIQEEASKWSKRNGNSKIRTDREAFSLLCRSLQGLTQSDAKRLIRNAIYDDGAISHSDIPGAMKAKYELLGGDGLLSFEYETARFNEVGGFEALKRWVETRKAPFIGELKGVDAPKGVMLLGVQGGGKSLAAKAVAGGWGVPLLRLDFARLYDKFFGESEKNVRRALQSAEAMAPCVLWIDEIEKGLATGDNDSGTSRRLLGSLLTWMAEKDAPVFIVATANDISALPPELIRKGRMDEIFFVDLPRAETRAEILRIHLQKRDIEHAGIELLSLAEAAEGFSGAELEQAVVSAIYSAHADSAEVNTELLLSELQRTRPLSVVMAEEIQGLRGWAAGRTVAVD